MNNENKVRAYIEEATIEILKSKELKNITIVEIIKKAGVCRASFYRNYADIDDVLNSYLSSLENKFLFDLSMEPRKSIERMFQLVCDNKSIFEIFLKRKLSNYIHTMLYHATYNSILKLDVLNNRYQPFFFSGAASSVILAWMKNGFSESPEEMSGLFIKSLNGYLKI